MKNFNLRIFEKQLTKPCLVTTQLKKIMVVKPKETIWKGGFIYHKFYIIWICTGCPDQIRPTFKITLLPNYKTYRKSEDSFRIVENRAKKH